jgi:hypothetical protein
VNQQTSSDRFRASVHEATSNLERELDEAIRYLNDEVVPSVRQHSTKALRVAAEKLHKLANLMDDASRW